MKRHIIFISALGLCLAFSDFAQAQFTIGGDANYSTNSESVGGTFEVMYSAKILPLVYFTPNARYRIGENKTSTFSAHAEARLLLPKVEEFNPYLGGGYAYYRNSPTRNAFADNSFDSNGFNLLGGVSMNKGGVQPYVQVRYFLNDNFDDLNVEAGRTL